MPTTYTYGALERSMHAASPAPSANHNETRTASHNERRSRSFDLSTQPRRVGVAALTVLTFYSVSGGPFGAESTVRAAGPLYTLLGYALFPLLWSVPEALIVAELSTAYPEDSGFVAWTEEVRRERGIAGLTSSAR